MLHYFRNCDVDDVSFCPIPDGHFVPVVLQLIVESASSAKVTISPSKSKLFVASTKAAVRGGSATGTLEEALGT